MGVENYVPVTSTQQWQSFLGLYEYRFNQMPTWSIWLYFGIWILGIFFSLANFSGRSRCINPIFWLLIAVTFPVSGSLVVILSVILSRLGFVKRFFTKERKYPKLMQKILKGRRDFRIADYFESLIYRSPSKLTRWFFLAPLVVSIVGRVAYEIYAAFEGASAEVHDKTATVIMLSCALLSLLVVTILAYQEYRKSAMYFSIYMNIPENPRNTANYFGRTIWEPSRNEHPPLEVVRSIAIRFFGGQLKPGTGTWPYQTQINNISYLVNPLSERDFRKLRDFEYAKSHRYNITEICELHWKFDDKGNLLPESHGTPEKKIYWRALMPMTTLVVNVCNALLAILILYTPLAMTAHVDAIAWFAETFTNLFS